MPTLDDLQKLADGPFHRLCDDLLSRLEPRYRRLRPHGINAQGVSIKGQPDSYVGDTANTCTIAFCYTVQRERWWTKLVNDVKEAASASASVREIVAAIPHNADRDGPRGKSIDWLGAARSAAGQAALSVVDGPAIARALDLDHQDLRFEHLGIPYSRLSGQSILASCHQANTRTIDDLVESGRYDPSRYTSRDADRDLFRLWQRALRPDISADLSRHGSTRLIALVNDAGVGKTSLLAEFVRLLGSVPPALLLQARNLIFGSEESLVAHVIHVLHGVVESSTRPEEEAAITYHLAAGTRLTIALDGLDEAQDAASVRKAITYWMNSRLGQASVLVVSSRPEFWKACVDRGWARWMHTIASPDDHTPTKSASGQRIDPTDGIRLPDRFSEGELEAAWVRADRSREQFFALKRETREELQHPFTLRVFLDLSSDGVLPNLTTRSGLLEGWLNRRLDAEAIAGERLTRGLFQEALHIIAKRLAVAGAGSVGVDDLAGVPRFDPIHPPGPVVARLLTANILESVPEHTDHLRFRFEAVYDFYRAQVELVAIVQASAQAAEQFAQLRFTQVYPRLAHLGRQLVNEPTRHQFVGRLASLDARMAALVLREDPARYTPQIRKEVTDALGRQIASRHRVRGAFAINLLSDLDCQEAGQCLAANLLPPAEAHSYLKQAGAMAFTKLAWNDGVELVYAWRWFGQEAGHEAYYFRDSLALMRGAKTAFKSALADHAWSRVGAESGSKEHGRAVCVLAYLGDERLAAHLDERITKNGSLQDYENHALVALGTDGAGQVFYRSAKATLMQITQFGHQPGTSEWASLHSRVSSTSADGQYLVTAHFEPYFAKLINDPDGDAFFLGFDLAIRSRRPGLIYHAVLAWSHQYFGGSAHWVRDWLPPDTWLGWWNALTDVPVRQKLLQLIPNVATGAIEEALIDCLDHADFRGRAAWHLGHCGCVRSAARLRQMLADPALEAWEKRHTALALGLLRDAPSIERLRSLALAEPKTETELFAVKALGLIGTPEAEIALTSLLGTAVDDGHVGAALMCCGTSAAVGKVIGVARSKADGPRWLTEWMSRAFWANNRRFLTEHYTHVNTTELVSYLAEIENAVESKWDLIHALEAIDSAEVRDLLRRWASRAGSPADPVVRDSDQLKMSWLCNKELMRRGDAFVIPYFLDDRADEKDDFYVFLAADNLSHFPSNAVAAEIRRRLGALRDNPQAVRLLSLLGRFGDSSDEDLIRPFLDHPDDLIANVACETLLRLTDPMLVPENWREL